MLQPISGGPSLLAAHDMQANVFNHLRSWNVADGIL